MSSHAHSTASISQERGPSLLKGLGLTGLSYGLFPMQDALVKWLVADYPVVEILFARSVVILGFAALIGGRRSGAALLASGHKRALVLRGVLILVAWLLYYQAAR